MSSGYSDMSCDAMLLAWSVNPSLRLDSIRRISVLPSFFTSIVTDSGLDLGAQVGLEPVHEGGGRVAMTPSDETLESLGVEVVLALGLVAVITGLVVFALLGSAARKVDVGVIVAVTILTLVAIMGFVATQQEALITLAGTGLGALAGAITNLIGSKEPGDADHPG